MILYTLWNNIFNIRIIIIIIDNKKINSIFDTESKIIHFMGSNKYIITKIECWPVFKQDPLFVPSECDRCFWAHRRPVWELCGDAQKRSLPFPWPELQHKGRIRPSLRGPKDPCRIISSHIREQKTWCVEHDLDLMSVTCNQILIDILLVSCKGNSLNYITNLNYERSPTFLSICPPYFFRK